MDRLSGPFSRLTGKVADFGRSMTSLGKGFSLGVTAPIAAAGTLAAVTGASTETSLNKMRAAGIKAAEDLARLKTAAGTFSDIGVSTSEAAAGMVDLVKAGLDADQVLAVLPASLQVAKSEAIETARASELLVNVVAGFKLPMTDAIKVTDALTTVADNTTTSFVDLAEALRYTGPIAAGMGLRFDEVAAALGALGQAGFKGEQGGVALRGILSDLAKPSTDALRVFKRLHIAGRDIVDSKGNVLSIVGALQLLEKHGATTSDVLTIFGDRGGPAMAALLGQGSRAVIELDGALSNAAGAGARKLAIMTEGAAAGFDRFMAKLKNLGQAIADSGLLEFATKLVVKLGAIVDWFSKLEPATLATISVFAGLAAAIGPLLIVIGQMALGWSAVVAIFGVVVPAIQTLAGTLLLAAAPSIIAVTTAVWAFTVALFACPLTWIVLGIMAVIGAIVLLWKYWDEIVAFLLKAWDWLVEKVTWWAKLQVDAIMWVVNKAKALIPDWLLDWFGGGSTDVTVGPQGEVPVDQVQSAAALGGGGGESRVRVDFTNVPRGTRVEEDAGGSAPLDMSLGMAMGTPG